MRILWLNWRDIKHPLAGGAEVYTHEIARRLAKAGHEIILVTSRPKHLPKEETIEGYKVIRRGGKYTVYYQAKKVYQELKAQGWKPDIVIDEVNTIPFLTPKYVKEPIIMLIHQLCKECWSYAIHPIAQPIGWWLERKLHTIYANAAKKNKIKTIITVSPSTKQDLINLGYPENKIHIVYNGLDWNFYKDCTELCDEKQNLVVYLGRITPYKCIEDILKAWRIVEQKYKDVRLVIAGRPDPKYLNKLRNLAKKLDLVNVEFKINISRHQKKMLLALAKILLYTSIREGWGQTIIEAAICKTPAIAYGVPGLRDSVKHLKTGILVKQGNVDYLAKTVVYILTHNGIRTKLAENAYNFAMNFKWNEISRNFLEMIKSSLK